MVRLKLENIEALGYTRGVIRLKYNSKNITINNLLGDSEQQLDQSSFPMGIALDDYVSNVNISNSLLKNHRQQRSSSSSYFNGDGIATESKVDDVNIVDTISSGNSDGDLQMLQYTASGKGKRFMLYLHHTDSVREWAYDKDSHIGRLDKGLEEAAKHNWTVIDMKEDWKVIYPFEYN